jgi:hypothetical protein
MQVLLGLGLLLQITVIGVLVRKYIRTRDAGFLWLGAAVVLWPAFTALLSHPQNALVTRLASDQRVDWYPANLVQSGDLTIGTFAMSINMLEQLVGMLLLLIAVFYLGRSRGLASPKVT